MIEKNEKRMYNRYLGKWILKEGGSLKWNGH